MTQPSRFRLLVLLAALLALPTLSHCAESADDTPPPAASPTPDGTVRKTAPTLTLREGKIDLDDGLAELNVPAAFRFLDTDDARKIIVDTWHNPPQAAEGVLGMLVPSDFESRTGHDTFGIVITYQGSGYVKDDDAGKINYDDLLKQMQKSAQDGNAERQKEGYPPVGTRRLGRAATLRCRRQEDVLGQRDSFRRPGTGTRSRYPQLRHPHFGSARGCWCYGPSRGWTSSTRSAMPRPRSSAW